MGLHKTKVIVGYIQDKFGPVMCILRGSKITADGDCSHEIMTLTPWKESYDQPRQHVKKQRHYFANKGWSSQGYGFPSSHV